MKILSTDEIKKIIQIAFEDGESWGIYHSTWFTPTPDDNENALHEATRKILKLLGEIA